MEWNKKIYEHEVPPPKHVWERIARDLDNEYFHFKEKLFHAEEMPPPQAWNNIQLALDGETNKKAPVFTLPFIFKMSAAAAVITILFFTTNYFLNTNDTVTNTTAQKSTQSPQQEITETKDEHIASPIIQPKQKEKLYIASNAGMRTGRRQENNQQLNVYSDGGSIPVPALELITEHQSAITDKYDLAKSFNRRVKNLNGEIKEDISLLDLPNSYFLMTGPDGQSIRVSSKFRNTIQYLNSQGGNEELLDVILRESRYWKNIFREWKDKVGNSAFIPSANNFMDITELMQLLYHNSGK